MSIPQDLKYTKEHEWLRREGEHVVVGITHHAQDQLGDVVFVDLPAKGAQVKQGTAFGTVESVKAVSDLFAPVSGEVVGVNEKLGATPEVVNTDPYGAAWMIKVRLANAAELNSLLSAADYAKLIAG